MSVRTPFNALAASVIVTARIQGPLGEGNADLMLDTGASYSMLSYIVLRALRYEPDASMERLTMITASRSESVPVIRVRRFQSLGIERLNFPVLCHNLPAGLHVDGLLGLDFVRRYRLSLDFLSGFITLRP